ncbi:MAG: hypothetical protein ACREXG_09555, partial [Polaromonas sp.]
MNRKPSGIINLQNHPHASAGCPTVTCCSKNKSTPILLPGYCPELNPDELLNQDVKTNALGKSRP